MDNSFRGEADQSPGQPGGRRGEAEKDGGATDRYFEHNRLTRARGGAGQGDVFDLCCCGGDTSATSQPYSGTPGRFRML